MRIGVLTGGGDCPGLNAAIRAIVRCATLNQDEIIGFHHGWRGVVEAEMSLLTTADTKGILQSGGTILHTDRYHPEQHKGGTDAVCRTVEEQRLEALIVIGGDGTLTSASRLSQIGIPLVGIPKTIDNDVIGTTKCIGFDTAVATAAEAIDRVHTTGESHDRLMVVEVMGRTVGWLAACAGIAAGADAICLPEEMTDIEALARAIIRRHDLGSSSSVVVVAEGAEIHCSDQPPASSAGARVASSLSTRTGYDSRLTVLGHIQRGGAPVPSDRLLATSFGVAAIDAVHAGRFASLVSGDGVSVQLVPIECVQEGRRKLPDSLLHVAHQLTVSNQNENFL